MKRSLISAIALGGLVVSAQAADLKLDSVKDAMPAIPDGPITYAGVTFYGTIDVGYAYAEDGSYPSGAFYNGVGSTIFGSPFNYGAVSTLNNNALSLSHIGIKIEEDIGLGFKAIGKLQTQFNPLSGELGDACASLLRYSGKPLNTLDNNGDGSRCGQLFADAAYAGLSNPIYGTLTIGRQTTLVADGMGQYDAIAGSPFFSLLGYSGTAGGGTGSTETTRWNNSIKYIFTYGPFHAAGMYTNGGDDTPVVEDAYGANVGFTYMGFSIDGFYTKTNGAVNLSRLGYSPLTGPLPAFATTCNAASGNCPNYLLGTITDNEAWDVMAKYTFDVPGYFGAPAVSTKDAPCGGLKDAPCPAPTAKLSIMGGYQYVEQTNPDHVQAYYSGGTTIGGYRYITTASLTQLAFGTLAFPDSRVRETAWAGIRYVDGPWSVAGAYYYFSQDAFLNNAGRNCAAQTAVNIGNAAFVGNTVANNCSGDFSQGSFVIDYTFNRHVDIYAGFTITDQTGGLNSGFLSDSTAAFATGVRVKW